MQRVVELLGKLLLLWVQLAAAVHVVNRADSAPELNLKNTIINEFQK